MSDLNSEYKELCDKVKEYDSLTRQERTAWDAFFRGASPVVSLNNPRFGKAECEWVDFIEFWLTKLVNLGWVSISHDGDNYIKIEVTENGWDIRDKEQDRRKYLSVISNFFWVITLDGLGYKR
jgi:hypothetical protein